MYRCIILNLPALIDYNYILIYKYNTLLSHMLSANIAFDFSSSIGRCKSNLQYLVAPAIIPLARRVHSSSDLRPSNPPHYWDQRQSSQADSTAPTRLRFDAKHSSTSNIKSYPTNEAPSRMTQEGKHRKAKPTVSFQDCGTRVSWSLDGT